ncbi:hypothetical protein OF83DRAFT_1177186 [Amylostereum chailletii]|nr:hypothetical protein OF83DRAFT_1177186 [Amylostereum chailletii]
MDAYRNESRRSLIEVLAKAKAKKTIAELSSDALRGDGDEDSVFTIGIDAETWLQPLADAADAIDTTDTLHSTTPIFEFQHNMVRILEELARASVAFFESEGLKLGFVFMVEQPISLFGSDPQSSSAAKLVAPPPLFLDFEDHVPLTISHCAVLCRLISSFDPPRAVCGELIGMSLTAKFWTPQVSVQVAPHVAAAELARLNQSGAVHAVMGTDFGLSDVPSRCHCVASWTCFRRIRSSPVEMSRSRDPRPGLVLTVMLSGIFSPPLRLFMPQIALEIGRIMHVAETLEKIIVDHGAGTSEKLLVYWRFNLRRLITCDPMQVATPRRTQHFARRLDLGGFS